MASRRSRVARKNRRSRSVELESLEARRLLTTLSGDGATFTYYDAEENRFRITLGGNITAEFVAGFVTANNTVALGDLVTPPPPNATGDVDGADLFAVYVTRADPQSFISIVEVDDQNRPTPYGASTTLNVINAQDGENTTVTGGANIGSGFLGARTIDIEATTNLDESDRPILFARLPAGGLGVIPPQPGNVLVPGLTVANNQNLGSFLFDGTVSGRVTATGSLGTFYSGWLVTGASQGQFVTAPARTDNFRVNGDLRNLIVKGAIGTASEPGTEEPTYYTGFDMLVRGVVGQVRANSHITGLFEARNAVGGPFLTGAQQEVEYRPPAGNQAVNPFLLGRLGGDPFFNNDSFETPQYVSGFSDPSYGGAKAVRIVGNIRSEGDRLDYYAIPLLAGQTVTFQIRSTLFGAGFAPNLMVRDPDGRVIATNRNNIDLSQTIDREFRITADRPGLYRIGVGDISTELPTGALDDDDGGGEDDDGSGTPSTVGTVFGDYSLRIQGVADMGIGAIVTDENFLALDPAARAIDVWRGDFGALRAGGEILSVTGLGDDTTSTISSRFGSVRVVEAAGIGTTRDGLLTLGLDLEVPFGNVGLLRTPPRTTTTDEPGGPLMLFNDGDNESRSGLSTIGGSYQLIESGGQFYGNVVANRGIGVIRVDNMGTANDRSWIEVNADQKGADGIIDLIDVQANMGSPAAGGPAIVTNTNGNLRYLRVGGPLYRDVFFGAGLGTPANTTVLREGEEITITDDSGALVNIRPNLVENPDYNPSLPPSNPNGRRYLGRPATIGVTTYPIRGSGGSAITNITADRSIVLSTLTSGVGRSAEVGRIVMTENGTPVVFARQRTEVPNPTNPSAPPTVINNVTDQLTTGTTNVSLDVSVFINGASPLDVLEIVSDIPPDNPTGTGDGYFGANAFAGGALNGIDAGFLNTIQNTSGGEMPIVRAQSISNLYGSTVGLAKSRATPTAVNPYEVLADNFPFQSLRIGVVAEDIVNIAATESLGNIVVHEVPGMDMESRTEFLEPPPPRVPPGGGAPVVPPPVAEFAQEGSGTIGSIRVNNDGRNVNAFEGIVAPIAAQTINFVNIGEGILPSGSGEAQRSGVFVKSRTRELSDRLAGLITVPYLPAGGDLRVVTNQGSGDIRGTVVATARIGEVTLTNGSLINADVSVLTTIQQAREYQGQRTIPVRQDPINNPAYDLGPITLTGNGGIIGSQILAADVDTVHVRQGFGIINSEIGVLGDGRVNRVIADGYGIRGTSIGEGGSVTEINATGNGQQVNSEAFSFGARLSEFGYRVDPYFQIAPNDLTDLHRALGTSRTNRFIENVTNSGIIDGVTGTGSRDLNAVYAQRIRNSAFNFANRIDVMQTRGPVRNVSMTTGRIGNLNFNGNVAQLVANVAGPVEDVYINGNLDERSNLRAIGPSGRIGRFQVNGFLAGDVTTTGVLNQLTVGRDILATSTITADEIATRQIGGQIFGQIVIT